MEARLVTAATALLFLSLLTGCAPVGTSPTPSTTTSGSPSPSPHGSTTSTPTPTPTKAVALPTDCREILSDAVLSQLDDVSLNDPAFGPSGVGANGTLTCIWADPAADTTSLVTTITRMNSGPALDLLNDLADNEGFSCFTPDGGTRCEKTWPNTQYPVTDGRTLFWRGDILIDTKYSNLAPSGYTASIVEHLFG